MYYCAFQFPVKFYVIAPSGAFVPHLVIGLISRCLLCARDIAFTLLIYTHAAHLLVCIIIIIISH